MKISVIIPHFRGEGYLRDCLESIFAQEYHIEGEKISHLTHKPVDESKLPLKLTERPEVEILIVLDGCTEDIEGLIRGYENSDDIENIGNIENVTIRLLSTGADGEPKGVAAARNIGIENATGEYLFFIDSDDYLTAGTFEALLTKSIENPGMMIRMPQRKTWFKREYQKSKAEERKLKRRLRRALRRALKRVRRERRFEEKELLRAQEMLEDEAEEILEDAQEEALENEEESGEDFGEDATDLTAEIEGEGEGEGEGQEDELEMGEEDTNVVSVHYWHGAATALGILIPRDVLGDERFNEEYRYYSDLPFMTRMCAKTSIVNRKKNIISRKKIRYYKRSHNDAVRMPSLLQEDSEGKKEEFIRSLQDAWDVAKECEPVEETGIIPNLAYLENYILAYVLRKLTKGKHPVGLQWTDEELARFIPFLEQIPKRKFKRKRYRFWKKRILKKLKKGNVAGTRKTAGLYSMIKKKRGLFGTWPQWKWNMYKRIFRRMSVKKNIILFESFLGRSYGDSCRYIYEYMLKLKEEGKLGGGDIIDPNPKFVWCIDNPNAKIPGKHKEVKQFSLKYFYYVARCAVWINNMRQPAWFEKRPGVTFLECWHGTPLKRLVFDMEDVHSFSPKYKMTVYKQSRNWDYLLSDNHFSTECFKSAFLYPEEQILELGYPRNDLLYGEDRDERALKVKEKLGIPLDKKVVLYAPTWRDDDYYGPAKYKFALPLDLELMKELRDEYFFVLRTHYFIADHLVIPEEDNDFVMDQSRYNDIGELYLISDILITDYSSVFFDFANLRRPILFFVYDFEKYAGVLRGFYFDMTTGCPGPLLRTNEEILDALKNIGSIEDEYKDKYAEFCSKFCYLDDGHASERIVKRVFGI